MSKYDASMDRDANYGIIQSETSFKTSLTWTFAVATTGALGAHTLFNVTGDVIAKVVASCTQDLTGATTTVEVGVSGNTATFLAQTTGTSIDNGHGWVDASPSNGENLTANPRFIAGGSDIIMTLASGSGITAGVLNFYCLWRPLSTDGLIVAATPA